MTAADLRALARAALDIEKQLLDAGVIDSARLQQLADRALTEARTAAGALTRGAAIMREFQMIADKLTLSIFPDDSKRDTGA